MTLLLLYFILFYRFDPFQVFEVNIKILNFFFQSLIHPPIKLPLLYQCTQANNLCTQKFMFYL